MPKLGKIGRSAACILLVLAVFVVYELRLVQWQLVEGDKYEQLSLSSRTDTIEIEAARGEILDRDGTVLAGNRSSYNIVYDALDMDYDRRNATIIQVIDLLEERGETWRDRLPIVLAEDGTYQYKEDSESAIQTLQEALSLAEYATAEECMAELAQQYDCQGYSKEDMRNVASVRYSMTQDGFSRTSPYVIGRGCFRRDGGRHQRAVRRVARHRGPGGGHPVLRGGRRLGPHVVGYHRRYYGHPVPAGSWRTAPPMMRRTTSPATSGATPWAARALRPPLRRSSAASGRGDYLYRFQRRGGKHCRDHCPGGRAHGADHPGL